MRTPSDSSDPAFCGKGVGTGVSCFNGFACSAHRTVKEISSISLHADSRRDYSITAMHSMCRSKELMQTLTESRNVTML